eukprot:6885485-Pyramimonas_sp.AAC.1
MSGVIRCGEASWRSDRAFICVGLGARPQARRDWALARLARAVEHKEEAGAILTEVELDGG